MGNQECLGCGGRYVLAQWFEHWCPVKYVERVEKTADHTFINCGKKAEQHFKECYS